jgi:hypothetical protein
MSIYNAIVNVTLTGRCEGDTQLYSLFAIVSVESYATTLFTEDVALLLLTQVAVLDTSNLHVLERPTI